MKHIKYLLFWLSVPVLAFSQTTTLIYSLDSQMYWSNPDNWDNGVPLNGYDVVILPGEYEHSILDIPNLELNSLTVTHSSGMGSLNLEAPLAVLGDFSVFHDQTNSEQGWTDIGHIGISVGGNVILVNCKLFDSYGGPVTTGGDFVFQGHEQACEFFPGHPSVGTEWSIGGDFWVPACADFNVSKIDFVVGGDFVLNAGLIYDYSNYGEMTLTLLGDGPTLVSLPKPIDPQAGAIESVTINKNSQTDLVILDTADWGNINVRDLTITSGMVTLRSDLEFQNILVDYGATFISEGSVSLRGWGVTSSGSVILESPGVSLFVGQFYIQDGSLVIGGSAEQPAWMRSIYYFDEGYLSSSHGTIDLHDLAIGNFRAYPDLVVSNGIDLGGNTGFIFNGVSASETVSAKPRFALSQNYPNPFNPSTRIEYELPEAGKATLAVFDLRGNLIRTLIDGQAVERQGTVVWNGQDGRGSPVAAGVYFYQITAPGHVASKKMLLLK